MFSNVLSLLAGLTFLAVLTAFSPASDTTARPEADQPGWEKLGKKKVNYALDRDVILVGARDGRFSKLKLEVTQGGLNMHRMVVHYGNGSTEEIALRHTFTRASGSRVIDLQGRRRVITKIVFWYDSKNISDRRATLHIFGRR